MKVTEKHLIEFEKEISALYEKGEIKAPIHLRDGNEVKLISIFREKVRKGDYVFSSWASHHHALLHGVPYAEVKEEVLQGRSITLHFPEYNFYSSAIVGGICPIAVGTSWALREKKSRKRVFCFIGDMTFLTGVASESIHYSIVNDLPITWVVEDNGKSVGTVTKDVWKIEPTERVSEYTKLINDFNSQAEVLYYKYTLTYPHAGVGKFVHF
jgi:TPP-dependent pyruvate/acetoin dehydrogenase alpha subunit